MAISPLFFNRSPSNVIGIKIMTREGVVYFFIPVGRRSRSQGVKKYLIAMKSLMCKER